MADEGRPKPVVIGLTGGIGCGKSAVLRTLEALGAEGIDADMVSHAVMTEGAPAYEPVLAEFGTEILAPNRQIDRRRLGQRVFGDVAALAHLENILHPLVDDAIRRWLAATAAPIVAIEAIKLLEAGLGRTLCDQVWVTVCSPETQMARLARSRGMSPEDVRRRRAMQMDQEAMMVKVNRVIDTNGTIAAMQAQVLTAWAELGLPLPSLEVRAARSADAEGVASVLKAFVRAGGLAVTDRTLLACEKQSFLETLPARATLTLALAGDLVAGFQTLERYAACVEAMDHVATMGTYVLPALRERGVDMALARATLLYARAAGYQKIVANISADDHQAEAYYRSLGFRPAG